jgi:phospholipase B1
MGVSAGNAALSGAMAVNLNEQVDYLIKYVKSSYFEGRDKFDTHWKYINIFIGANDACVSCSNMISSLVAAASPSDFGYYLRQALMRLREHFPRSIVNVLHLPDLTHMYDLVRQDPECFKARKVPLYNLECHCIFGDETQREKVRKTIQAYNDEIAEVVYELNREWKYDMNQVPFGLINEHALDGTNGTAWPVDMVSYVDCFHPSTKAHAYFANIVWYVCHLCVFAGVTSHL